MLTAQNMSSSSYLPEMSSSHIRAAGITTSVKESAADCLAWTHRPTTPPEQKKYRQSTIHEPGKIVRHPGVADDPIPDKVFGRKTDAAQGSNITDVINSFPETEIARWKLERAEDIYASTKREPLGHGYQRGFKIPEQLSTERGFGVTYDALGKEAARQAATVIFPTDLPADEDEQAKTMYKRSHAAYEPGEQRQRNYDWSKAGIDPVTHRFGAVDKLGVHEGVRQALQADLDRQAPCPVVSKIQEDFKLTATDHLGKPKVLGANTQARADPNYTYGAPSMRRGREPGVDELMRTGYSTEQQQPDADLGKSLREGWRNIAPEDRVFGIPTVRSDVRLPKMKSVANSMNYGNEPDAHQLLQPTKSAERGVGEEHYTQQRAKQDLRKLVAAAGIDMHEEDFDSVFQLAVGADGQTNTCCLDTFFRARHHVLAQNLVVPMP